MMTVKLKRKRLGMILQLFQALGRLLAISSVLALGEAIKYINSIITVVLYGINPIKLKINSLKLPLQPKRELSLPPRHLKTISILIHMIIVATTYGRQMI
jgi:hypothetical protein